MLLKKLILENIRSYKNQVVDFSEGIVVLSGDIGSGKTSIIMAIEFALFGVTTDVTYSSLLRHGSDSGSIELSFELGSETGYDTYVVKRVITSRDQKEGFLTENGIEKQYGITQLKSKIMDILGYPKSLVDKKKIVSFQLHSFNSARKIERYPF